MKATFGRDLIDKKPFLAICTYMNKSDRTQLRRSLLSLFAILLAGCTDDVADDAKTKPQSQPTMLTTTMEAFEGKMKELHAEADEKRLAPTEERIQEFENHIGAKLPGDYREFLSKYAGTRVSATCPCHEPTPFGPSATIGYFLGFMPDDRAISSLAENSDDAEGAPLTIPIAQGAFGGQVFVFVTGKLAGRVYFYDGDQRCFWPDEQFHRMFQKLHPTIQIYLNLRKAGKLPEKPKGMENFYLLAKDFKTFMEAMEYWDLDADD